MPGLDNTGPQGQGPMTGGTRGNCNTQNTAGQRFANPNMGFGRGMAYGRQGRNFGSGMGFRRGFGRPVVNSTVMPVDELNNLKAEVELLNKRIAELESSL